MLLLLITLAFADAPKGEACLARSDLACAQNEAKTLGKTDADRAFAAHLAFYEQRFEEADTLLRGVYGAVPTAEQQRELALYAATVVANAGFKSETRGDVTIRYLPGPDEVLLDDAFTTLQAAHDRIGARLGGAPPGGVRMEIYPTADRFIAASGIPAESVRTTGVVALSKWTRLLITSPRALGRGYAWRDTVAHEYIHYIISWNTADRCPVWLQEGVARSHEVLWRRDDFDELPIYQQSLLAEALSSDQLVPLERMHPSMAFLPSAEMTSLAFAQVATMVQYLNSTAGDDAVRRALVQVRAGTDALQAVADVGANGNAELFMADWKAWIRGLKFVSRKLSAMPTILGEADDVASDPVLASRADLAGFARLGDLLMKAERPAAALIEYEKAVPPDEPSSPALAVRTARALIALDQAAAAQARLEASITDYPEHAGTRKALAALLSAQGKPGEALAQYLASADINPFDPEVQGALATLYTGLGKPDEAARRTRYLRILKLGGS